MSDEPGYGDGKQYFAGNETVRFVTSRQGDDPTGFKSVPFQQWGEMATAEPAMKRAATATADRVGTDAFDASYGRPPDDSDIERIVVYQTVRYDIEDGQVVDSPAVPFTDLVAAAPRSVETTLSMADRTYTRTVPVFAEQEPKPDRPDIEAPPTQQER